MNRSLIALMGTSVVLSAQAEEIVQEDLNVITGSEDWNILRTAWITLNKADAPEDQLAFTMASEKRDSICSLVNALFQDELPAAPEVTRAVQMLKDITVMRATRLSRINPLLMTRMMPPWTATVREDLLFNFEIRIHALTELLLEGNISASEFIAGRDSLLDRSMVIMLLETVDEIYQTPDYGYAYPDYQEVTTDSVLHRLDMTYRAALDSLSLPYAHQYADHYKSIVEQHERFLLEYNEFRNAAPVFRILLETLMEAED